MIELRNFGEDVPIHTYSHGNTTIGRFIDSKTKNRKKYVIQPLYITVNGEYVPSTSWDNFKIKASDVVIAEIITNGGVFSGLANILSGVLSFAFGWIMPSARSPNTRYDNQQGVRLDQASVKANVAELGDYVLESFGRYRIYPRYLTLPRRYYKNKRTQMLEFTACVGVGWYEFDPAGVRIVDTPVSQIAGAKVIKYEPGQSMSADPAHFNWYTADEVGGTSSGTAGLELSTEEANRENTDPESYFFDGLVVQRQDGDFPPGWGEGATVRIKYASDYAVGNRNMGSNFEPINASSFTGYVGHLPKGVAVTDGIFAGWSALVVDGDGGSVGTVVFYKDTTTETQTVRTYLSGVPIGTRSYTLGDLYDRAILNFFEKELVFSAYPFQQDTTIEGATIQFSGGAVYGEWSGPFNALPLGEKTRLLEIDILAVNGLGELNDDGKLVNRTVTIEVQFRDVNATAWERRTYTYTESTRDQLGFTHQIAVNNIEPVVRVRRVGAASVSERVFDTMNWYGLKCRLPGRTTYPGWTTITCSFESGGKIAAQSENQINVIATRMLETVDANGNWSNTRVPTRDILPACRYMWGTVRYTDDDAAMEHFLRLHNQFWLPRNETFDYALGRVSVKDAINSALGAGMAEMTVEGGRIKPIRDMKRTLRAAEKTYAFSDQGVIGGISEDFKPWTSEDYDGVEIEYVDPVSFEPMTVRYVLPGKQGFKIEKIKINGVTDRRRAWVIAARKAWANFVRNKRATFKTEMMGRLTQYWGFIKIISNNPLISQTGYVLGAKRQGGATMWKSSERIQTEQGKQYLAGYRSLDGEFIGPFVVRDIIEGRFIKLDESAPLPMFKNGANLPHLYFGVAEAIENYFLLEDITYDGFYNAQVKAVNYDERVYQEDDNSPPPLEY